MTKKKKLQVILFSRLICRELCCTFFLKFQLYWLTGPYFLVNSNLSWHLPVLKHFLYAVEGALGSIRQKTGGTRTATKCTSGTMWGALNECHQQPRPGRLINIPVDDLWRSGTRQTARPTDKSKVMHTGTETTIGDCRCFWSSFYTSTEILIGCSMGVSRCHVHTRRRAWFLLPCYRSH
jgi:hypothetical protein